MYENENEKWKEITGFEGQYAVSSLGRVKSLERTIRNGKHRKEKLLKPQFVGDYLGVYLPDPVTGKQKWEYIHRLVARAFLENPDNLPQVNHKNEVKTDNRVENLEWCDQQYNTLYGSTRDKIRDTNVENGRWKDYTGWTDEEIKEDRRRRSRERYKETHSSYYDHTIYVYEQVMTYKLVEKYKNITKAAEQLGVDKATLSKRVRGEVTKPLKNRYLVSRGPIQDFPES